MRIELRNKYLSRPRYKRYLIATGSNNNRAKKLYNANLRLAQSFHPIISQFEVVLRNSLNIVLTRYFTDPDWIINQKTGFMKDPSLGRSHFFLKNSVQKAENKLAARSIPLTSGKIISDQNFGFWLAFFLPHNYSLVGGQPIQIFVNKPLIENRASIYSKLIDIKNFRNRINHCEPLCFTGNNIDCSYVIGIREKLYDLIEWIEPDLVPFFQKVDNIQNKVNYIMTI